MNSPMQHPNQHAPASPLYVYPMYSAFHPPGPQYYPHPNAHVNNVMEDAQEVHEININAQDNQIYQQQVTEEYNEVHNARPIVNNVEDSKNDDPIMNNKVETVINRVKVEPVVENVKTIPKCSAVMKNEPKNEPKNESKNELVKNEPEKVKEVIINVPNSVVQSTVQSQSEVEVNVQKISPVNNSVSVESVPVNKLSLESKPSKVVSTIVPEVANVLEVEKEQVVTPPVNKSWASLFSAKSANSAQETVVNDVSKTPKTNVESPKSDEEKIPEVEQNKNGVSQKSVYKNDPVSHRMGGKNFFIYVF